MKVGILGNMNNSGFAIMRYFRDLGIDAHLLLYSDDGKGMSEHFQPTSDTWQYQTWAPYIHQTKIASTYITALEFPFSMFHSATKWVLYLLGWKESHTHAVSNATLQQTFAGYDKIIGSGIAPVVFVRLSKPIDIFFPFSTGVEWVADRQNKNDPLVKRVILGAIMSHLRKVQIEGIQRARHVLNAETGLTETALKNMGVNPKRLMIPAVYNREMIPSLDISTLPLEMISRVSCADFCMFSAARQIWLDESASVSGGSKNNHWLIHSLSRVKQARPNCRILLILMEYGADVQATRRLVNELNLEENVVWLPLASRKFVMQLLRLCDIAVGEFYETKKTIWGGTGWEAFAAGKPFLNGFIFSNSEFEELFGIPQPPILAVRTQEDIDFNILNMIDHPLERKEIGEKSRTWFDTYNGIGLAKRWVDLLT
jgi:glycosyltransferase involved in cell wall biosynthesis